MGGFDVGFVNFSKNLNSDRGENDFGVFVRVSKPVEDSLGALLDPGVFVGLTVGVGTGTNIRSTFDGTDASIKAGLLKGSVSVGGLLSEEETSLSFEYGPAVGVGAIQEQTFSVTVGDLIETVKSWFATAKKE